MAESLNEVDSWRRRPCLGCDQTVKRARDAWTEIIGTRTGTWLAAMPMGAGKAYGDSALPPKDAVLELLGVAHRRCAWRAARRIKSGDVRLLGPLPRLFVEQVGKDEPSLQLRLPKQAGTCPFCSGHRQMTDEHIYPEWLLKEIRARGARFVHKGRTTDLIISPPKTPVCEDCNRTWMATLENDISQILRRMFDLRPMDLQPEDQARLALWAAKIAILVDVANPTPLVPRGFGQDLRIQKRPHAGMSVWLASYGGRAGGLTARQWLVMSEDVGPNESVIGYCLTFTAFRVAFQVFIPFYAGDLAPLEDFGGNVKQLWPPQAGTISWPPPYCFDENSIAALSCRIYDNREPVTMDVTLHATPIRR